MEHTLPDGGQIAVEVRGPEARARATRAIELAGRAIGAEIERRNQGDGDYCGLIGRSEVMLDLYRVLDRIRSTETTVLVTGENGTGKELVARAIHRQSPRANKKFVAANCSAFNDNLLESELFGHARGAFTGAVADKAGLFQIADGGTFFMDEVGEMSPALQVKLLRVLQEGVLLPVGSMEQRKVDVRIIAATNRDLSTMVKEGTFREDLFYRLHVVALKVPALRKRAGDLPLLIDYFLRRLAARDGRRKKLAPSTLAKLAAHDWPGNVRELENEIERLWVLSGEEDLIGEEHMTPAVARSRSSVPPPAAPAIAKPSAAETSTLPDAVEALERAMISEGLKRAGGNKTRAAEQLGISRRNLIRKVQAYGLEDLSSRSEDDT